MSEKMRSSNLDEYKQQELSIIVWAYGVLGALQFLQLQHEHISYCVLQPSICAAAVHPWQGIADALFTGSGRACGRAPVFRLPCMYPQCSGCGLCIVPGASKLDSAGTLSSALGRAAHLLSRSTATAGVKDAEILNAIIDAILKKDVGTFYPQALSNVTWACATLEHLNTRYLDVRTPSLCSGHGLRDREGNHNLCLMSASTPTSRALDFQQPPNRQILACPRPGRRQMLWSIRLLLLDLRMIERSLRAMVARRGCCPCCDA